MYYRLGLRPLSPQTNGGGEYDRYHDNYTFSLKPVDELLLEFKPRLAESRCGGRSFRVTFIEGNQPGVVNPGIRISMTCLNEPMGCPLR